MPPLHNDQASYSHFLFIVPSFHYSNIPVISLQFFIGFDGADVVPVAFVDDDPPDRSRFFHDSSDKGRNDGFDFAGVEIPEERCLHGIDAGKEAALSSRVSQDIPKIADLTGLIDIYIQKRAAAS